MSSAKKSLIGDNYRKPRPEAARNLRRLVRVCNVCWSWTSTVEILVAPRSVRIINTFTWWSIAADLGWHSLFLHESPFRRWRHIWRPIWLTVILCLEPLYGVAVFQLGVYVQQVTTQACARLGRLLYAGHRVVTIVIARHVESLEQGRALGVCESKTIHS